MDKKIFSIPNAPAPVGPYNQAVQIGKQLYVSGQIPISPATGQLMTGDVRVETRQVMENLKVLLEVAGATFENVAKCSIFLTDMNDYNVVNEIYARYFNNDTAPARECVQVAALPKGARVEISLIAHVG